MYDYIDNVFTIEKMENPEHFYQSGRAFGEFAKFLTNFDASSLEETIKDFHNTPVRFQKFELAVSKNKSGRVSFVCDEIEKDLSLVDFDLDLYRHFAKGYIEEAGDYLAKEEINMLPYASIMLTLECGMKFLTNL